MEHAIKYFGLNNVSLEHDLRRVAREKKIQLRPSRSKSSRDAYYPQITERIRHDASIMAQHYELFYCLETSIRDLIRARLAEKEPNDWWDKHVPQFVHENAIKNRTKEIESGVTPRSTDLLDYTNFGELGEIIKANWELFGDTFADLKCLSHHSQKGGRWHRKAAARFIAAPEHEKMHDERLWDLRQKRDREMHGIPEWEELRSLASAIKEHTLTHLDGYLDHFEANARSNGVHVHWARDAAEHNRIVHSILKDHGAKSLIKSKSMLTEECGFRHYMAAAGIEVIKSAFDPDNVFRHAQSVPPLGACPGLPLIV
jgi:LUD domain/Berberine and berberine like